MSYEQILFETDDDGIATITLNRPERLNAYTAQMLEELFDALEEVEKNDDLRVTVLTGAGRGFCAGADLGGGGDTFDTNDRVKAKAEGNQRKREPLAFYFSLTKPVIVAVNGPAVGIGVTMILPFDIRIASESAKMGLVFNRRGILPELASPWLLPKIIGLSKALDLMYTGKILTANEALDYGLVSRVYPDDQLLDEAHKMAKEIAVNCAPVSIALTKSMTYRFLQENDLEKIARINEEYFEWLGQQPDPKEGVMSFIEKRSPEWKMKSPRDLPNDFPFQ